MVSFPERLRCLVSRFRSSTEYLGRGLARCRSFGARAWTTGFLLLFAAMPLAAQTRFETELDRPSIALGETVTLRLRAVGDLSGEPDLRPLTKDFEIIDQTRWSSFGGASNNLREWLLVLAPRRSGRISIPPLSLSGVSGTPTELTVLGAPASAGSSANADGRERPGRDARTPASTATQSPPAQQPGFDTDPVGARSPAVSLPEEASGDPGAPDAAPADAVALDEVFMEVEAEPERPYLHVRVRYRVRILTRVPLRQATLSEPRADGALIRRLGEDRRTDVERDGARYRVLERLYAIIPQRIGSLRIAAPRLSAAVPAASLASGRTTGQMGPDPVFERLETVVRVGRELMLDVRPIPVDSLSSWLPAESLSVSEQWQPPRDEVRVGEPITRTLLLEASGLLASSMPPLEATEVEGFRVYSQAPTLREQVSGEDLLVTAEIKQTLVPTLAGAWELPAVRLPWWSLGMDEPRLASLPARRVLVVDTSGPAVDEQRPGDGSDASVRERFVASASGDLWGAPWLALMFALAWILTLALWLRDRRRGMESPRAQADGLSTAAERGGGDMLRDLQRAIRSADARAARTALLAWGRQRWPQSPPRGPVELMLKLNAEAAAVAAAADIERSLYARELGKWDAGSARESILGALGAADRERQPDEPGLPRLYPG